MEAFAIRVMRADGSSVFTLIVDGMTAGDFPRKQKLEEFARHAGIKFSWLSGVWKEQE